MLQSIARVLELVERFPQDVDALIFQFSQMIHALVARRLIGGGATVSGGSFNIRDFNLANLKSPPRPRKPGSEKIVLPLVLKTL